MCTRTRPGSTFGPLDDTREAKRTRRDARDGDAPTADGGGRWAWTLKMEGPQIRCMSCNALGHAMCKAVPAPLDE